VVARFSIDARHAVITMGLLAACANAGESGSGDDSLPGDSLASASSQRSTGSAVASVGPTMIRLQDCRVTVQASVRSPESRTEIPLPGGCRFVLDADGKPQTVNTGRGPTLLAMSSTRLPDGRFCDTRVRAIVVRDGGVVISEREQRIRSCATGPFDTKMFHVLAESVKGP
jgi:hypothetical protein